MGTIKRKLLWSSGVLMGPLASTQVVFADHPTLSESEVLSIRNQTPYAVWKGGNDITPAEYKGANTAVTKLYHKWTSGGQHWNAVGTGTFISPNVILTVGHNYLQHDNAENGGKLPDGHTYFYNLGTVDSSPGNAYAPTDGVNKEIGGKDEISRHMKHKDPTKFYKKNTSGGSSVDWQWDFALTVVDEPMQFTSPDKEAEPLEMIDKAFTPAELVNKPLHYAGYGQDFTSGNKGGNQVKNPNIHAGQFLSVKTKVHQVSNEDTDVNGTIVTWQNSSFGGFSGSALRTDDEKVIGVLQAGGPESDKDINLGLAFNQKTLDWIKGIVKQNQIKGWRDHQGYKYYFQDNGHLYRNTTQAIDGRRWQFDKYGVATDIGTAKKGSVAVDFLDTDGKKIVDSKTIVKDDYEGTDFNFDPATDPVIKKLVDSGEWKLKQVDDGSGKKDVNGTINGKVGDGAKTIKLYFERLVYTIDVEYAGANQKENLNNGGKGWKIGEKVKVKPKAIPGYFTKDAEKEVTIGKTNKVVFNYTKETNIEALKRGIDDAKGALNQDFTEGRYKVADKDTRINNLKNAVKQGEEVKQRIEEEKIRRIRAEYKQLLQEIQDYQLKAGSKNEGLLTSLTQLESELRTGSDTDLKVRIASVRGKFNVVKSEDAKTQETYNFSFETLSARRVDVSLDDKSVLGKEVTREETGKDGKHTVDVTSKLGKVTGLVVKGEEAKRLRLVLGTRHDAKLLRLEGERFNTRKAKAGELKREGVTGIVEVWQMGDEVVKLEVRRPVDRVE